MGWFAKQRYRKKGALYVPEDNALRAPVQVSQGQELDRVLGYLGDMPVTVRMTFEHFLITGGVGSSKTTGSGAWLARGMLPDYGGLILCVKDDLRMWERWADMHGRREQMIVVSATDNCPWRVNFLDWEMRRAGPGAGLVDNIVNLFMTIMEVSEGTGKQGNNDPFWDRALKQLLRNAITLVKVGTGTVSLPDIYRCITTAPASFEQGASPSWQANSLCYRLIEQADMRAQGTEMAQDVELAGRYFLSEYPSLSDKTRSSVVLEFTSMADAFMRWPLRTLFCSDTNFVPELTFTGALIVVHLPVLEYGQVGRYAAVLLKYLFQQAVNRRQLDAYSLPVTLWSDESQYTVCTSSDALFLSTCRSSRCAVVYLVQSLAAYYDALGGGMQARDSVDFLLGMFNNRIWHANTCHLTNQHAADTIAKGIVERPSTTTFFAEGKDPDRADNQSYRATTGMSQVVDYEPGAMPKDFVELARGGPEHDFRAQAIVFLGGRKFPTGKTWGKTAFPQDILG